MSAVSFADANSDAFAQVFKEASKQGGSIIGRVVNALYYGMLIIYRGVSLKLSQICGFILLSFMIMNILKVILQNIERMDIYSIFKMILPGFIKNLIIGFILVTPGGMTGDLSETEFLGSLGKNLKNIVGDFRNTESNNFYHIELMERQQKEANKMIIDGWNYFVKQIGEVHLSTGANSMNEGIRINAQNSLRNGIDSGIDSKDFERYTNPSKVFNPRFYNDSMTYENFGLNIGNYINQDLENLNRNNINKITKQFLAPEEVKLMIENK